MEKEIRLTIDASTSKIVLADKANPVLNKQANIFTTNYDPIIEIALEQSKCMCNDGFEGRLLPLFSTSNFSKTYYREAFFKI